MKTIYLEFSFFKKKSDLVIIVSTRVATANIGVATIHEILNMKGA